MAPWDPCHGAHRAHGSVAILAQAILAQGISAQDRSICGASWAALANGPFPRFFDRPVFGRLSRPEQDCTQRLLARRRLLGPYL